MRYVCVIPAKRESERAPGKNEALWRHTLGAALSTVKSSRVIVSTDSDEIRREALEVGARVHWRGSLNLEGVPAYEVTLAVLSWLGAPDEGHVIQLLPTAPLRSSQHIRDAIRAYEARDPGHSALISVTPVHGRALCYEGSDGLLHLQGPRLGVVDGEWDQPLPMYVSNGAIQITGVKMLRLHGSFWDVPKRIPFLMDHRAGFDVDSIAQLGMARQLLEGGRDGSG